MLFNISSHQSRKFAEDIILHPQMQVSVYLGWYGDGCVICGESDHSLPFVLVKIYTGEALCYLNTLVHNLKIDLIW